MSSHDAPPENGPRPPWRPQFGLGVLMLTMLVICVAASGGYYLMQALQGGVSWMAVFVIFVLIAPMLLMSILSLGRLVLAWLNARFGRRA